ncbi:hypothetical protein D3C81_2052800 [compost metagenome]
MTGQLAVLHIQHTLCCTVNQGKFPVCINHDNSPGHIIKHALQQIFIVPYGLELGLQAVRHRIDRFSQLADLILTLYRHSGIIIQIGNPAGNPGNLL